MRHFNRLLVTSLAVLFFAPLAAAQQKPAEQETLMIPVKVKVVLSEYDGTKEISSLPYAVTVNAFSGTQPRADQEARGHETHLRMGLRVPINNGTPSTGQFGGGSQFQYQEVGTNIDCWAVRAPNGDYQVNLNVTRSTVYQPNGGKVLGATVNSGNPVILDFTTSNTLILRNGQTDESTVATDPVSGHLLRVSVTLNVVKEPGK